MIKRFLASALAGLLLSGHAPLSATISSVNGGMWFPSQTWTQTALFSQALVLIDATDEKVENVFRVSRTATIKKIGFVTGTVSNSQTLRVSLQTLDAAGNASGTYYAGSSSGTQTSPATGTAYTVTLTTGASAVLGDMVAAVIEFDGTIGSVNITRIAGANSDFAYNALYTTSWTRTAAAIPRMWVEYNDGTYTYIPGVAPYSGIASTAFNSESTADEYALYVKFPVQVTANAMQACFGAAGSADLILYDSDGTTVLETVSITSSTVGSTAFACYSGVFSTDRTLTADTYYRVSLKPTTATSVTLQNVTYPSVAALDQDSGGQEVYMSTRADAGSWTNITTQRPKIFIHVNGMHGAGGGGQTVYGGFGG